MRSGPDHETDALRRILSRGSIYTLAVMAQLGSGFLVLPFLTRVLSPEQYGIVTAALITFWILGLLSGLGLPAAVSRTYFSPGGMQQVRALVVATFLAAVLAAAVAASTGPLWSNVFENLSFGLELQIAVLAAVPAAVLFATQNALRAADRPAAFVTTAILATAVAQLLGLGGALLADAAGYLGGLAMGYLLAAVVGASFVGVDRYSLLTRQDFRKHLAYGLPTVPHSIAIYVLTAGDRVIVERLEGLVAAGRYNLAYVVGSLGIILASAVNNAWAPEIFRTPDERRWEVLAGTAARIFGLAALIAVALALAAPVALEIIAPPDYRAEELAGVSVLVAAAVLPFIWYLANVSVVLWLGATRSLAWMTPTAAAVNIGLNFTLIPVMGLEGAALATVVSYGVLAFLVGARTSKLAAIPWHRATMARVFVGTVIALAAVFVLPADGIWQLLRLVVAVGVSGTALKIATVVPKASATG